jgi:multiple sugar transport system ATP-binding protein
MKDGELLQIGPPMEIYDFPVNRFVGGFVGSPSMNFLHGTLLRKGYTLYFRLQSSAAAEGTELTVLQVADETTASLTRYVDRELILGLRPEDISLAAGSDAGGLAATVERVERLGAVSQARLRIGSDSMMVRLDSSALFRKNDVVSVTCRMARAHFFDPASGHRAGSK